MIYWISLRCIINKSVQHTRGPCGTMPKTTSNNPQCWDSLHHAKQEHLYLTQKLALWWPKCTWNSNVKCSVSAGQQGSGEGAQLPLGAVQSSHAYCEDAPSVCSSSIAENVPRACMRLRKSCPYGSLLINTWHSSHFWPLVKSGHPYS